MKTTISTSKEQCSIIYLVIEFQRNIRPLRYNMNSLLMLTIVSDDVMLGAFNLRAELPRTSGLLERCDYTYQSLPARCAGLLELTPVDPDLISPSTILYHYLRVYLSFTHRTAIDFVFHSDAGIDIFAAHATGHEEIFARIVKTDLVLFCLHLKQRNIFDYLYKPHLNACHFFFADHKISRQTVHILLSLTRRCLKLVESMNLVKDNNQKDIMHTTARGGLALLHGSKRT